MKQLHIFNPHHDLALANSTPTFKAPEFAMVMAHDFSLLPAWYANAEDIIISDLDVSKMDWKHLPPMKVVPKLCSVVDDYESIFPWGWDLCVAKYLDKCEVARELMPSAEELNKIRDLSHRKIASEAMEYIAENSSFDIELPLPAKIYNSIAELKKSLSPQQEVVFKAPWSSSGKGVFWCKPPLTTSVVGWCSRIMEKQGEILVENAYDKIQDFAIEFFVDENGQVEFKGYSLFFTERAGIYRGNRLMSNEDIESELSQWISVDYLRHINYLWSNFIKEKIAPYYSGYLGVDMIIYKNGENYLLNPAIELNLRMTMGMVARLIYDKYMSPGSKGWFRIDHTSPGQALIKHHEKQQQYPLIVENDKIKAGYISLCPVSDATVYVATIVAEG